ncbi:MAG: PorT family protein [Prevotellaceae bacterium]|nr:PorT family protein [Candidatus Faecinaster equi]
MKKIFYILVFILMIGNSVSAQIGEYRNLLSIGVNAGMGFNNVSFDPVISQTFHKGITAGVTIRYISEKYFTTYCAIQAEVNYASLGWTEDIMNQNSQPLPDTYERNLSYIQVPLLARLSWGKEQRGLQFFILAGPQFGYLLSESSKKSDVWTLNTDGKPDRPNQVNMQYDMNIERKFDYGLTGGLGLELNSAIGHIMLEGRYYYGLGDMYGNSKKDPFSRSAHGTIIAKMTYLFDVKK